MRLPFSLFPREQRFFDLFQESASNVVATTDALCDLMFNWTDVSTKAKRVSELEHVGDTITHTIIAQMHRTFVTPLDREDITALCQSMDDVVDLIDAAVDGMLLYQIAEPTTKAQGLARVLRRQAEQIEKAVALLRSRSKLKSILDYCIEVHSLENEGDVLLRSALAELFSDQTAVIDILKWRLVYDDLETATDRCEDVANVLEAIVLKHA
jgi:predicted phosphate transport protein (TIGR00153 family)